MKKLYLIAVILFSVSLAAQINSSEIKLKENSSEISDNYIYDSDEVEKEPYFEGGIKAYRKVFMNEFKYPKYFTNEFTGKSVKVITFFIIEKDGTTTGHKIVRDPGYDIGKETLRVIKLLPKFKPAEINGLPVRSKVSLPIEISRRK